MGSSQSSPSSSSSSSRHGYRGNGQPVRYEVHPPHPQQGHPQILIAPADSLMRGGGGVRRGGFDPFFENNNSSLLALMLGLQREEEMRRRRIDESFPPLPPPEVQQATAIQSGFAIEKDSLVVEEVHPAGGLLRIRFRFRSDTSCCVRVYYFAVDTFDSNRLTRIVCLDQFRIPEVIFSDQVSDGGFEYLQESEYAVDLTRWGDEIFYKEGTPRFPLVIELRRLQPEDRSVNALFSFFTFARDSSGKLELRRVKQRIELDGKSFDLQEIYGMDSGAKSSATASSSASAPTQDEPIDNPDESVCVVCMSDSPQVTVLPCRHHCLCESCANMLRSGPLSHRRCPLCRSQIERFLQIQLTSSSAVPSGVSSAFPDT